MRMNKGTTSFRDLHSPEWVASSGGRNLVASREESSALETHDEKINIRELIEQT